MLIHRIFETLKNKLWAVQWEGELAHVLRILQDNWSDIIWLQDFFEGHKADLQSGFYGRITVDEAVDTTYDESYELFEALEEDEGANLDNLFRPLNDREYQIKDYQKQKAKGSERKTWLRIYAVKFADGYVITGGAIKLTKTMQEREHTDLELTKMSIVRDALKLNTASDKFIDLE
ncbi:hypothetical protein JMN32_10630 [Fulvivirga sp. 29W222]|uniref:Uncharacterized protein n=1 Tax=Fulvivirga marina TaxID=2494733 RepID=A0A937FVK3_9BACT|nr:hypothetical protein [Fulvivirga marina]MBL6446769.1 hypothetical protein [Fulvivirga marina]